ncbi:MAG: CBS domain-containing protein [Candidatus Dormibacterales bacterium]
MTTVRDVMHSGLITCAPSTMLADVAALLRKHRIHALVVTDGDKGAVGVVSDTDLLAGEWLGTNAENVAVLRRMTAGELMSKPLATIAASSSVEEAAAEIRRLHVARLLVTDGAISIGVLSESDLLAVLPRHPTQREKVSDVMSWGYVACSAGTPVDGAVRAMQERDSRSLVVIDDHGQLVGVVTGFDLLACLSGESRMDVGVTGLMKQPITIGPEASLQEAVDLMLDKSIHRLVVVDQSKPGGPPLGIISTTDIMVEMVSPDSAWR